MLLIVVSAIAGAAGALLLGYGLHRFTHWPGSGFLYRSHMSHHQRFYPPERFASAVYKNSGKDGFLWVLVGLGVLAAAACFCFLPLGPAVAAAASLAIFGGLHVPLHDATHVRPNRRGSRDARQSYWLGRLWPRWMRRHRRLHYIHHADMGSNFGIYSFAVDRLFRTFRDLT